MIHVEQALLAFLAVSAVLHWLAPFSIARGRVRLTTRSVTLYGIPALEARRVGIVFYTAQDLKGYAFSCRLGFKRAVVVDETFYCFAQSQVVAFVMAHEIAHHVLGHVRFRWLCQFTFAYLIPAVRRALERTEDEANEWAELATGLPRSIVWGIDVKTAAGGPSGYPTEETEA